MTIVSVVMLLVDVFNSSNPNNKLSQKILGAMGVRNEKPTNILRKSAPPLYKRSMGTGKAELAELIVEKTTIRRPNDLQTYADSGATIHCFRSKHSFEPGAVRTCHHRTVLLADETSRRNMVKSLILLTP